MSQSPKTVTSNALHIPFLMAWHTYLDVRTLTSLYYSTWRTKIWSRGKMDQLNYEKVMIMTREDKDDGHEEEKQKERNKVCDLLIASSSFCCRKFLEDTKSVSLSRPSLHSSAASTAFSCAKCNRIKQSQHQRIEEKEWLTDLFYKYCQSSVDADGEDKTRK